MMETPQPVAIVGDDAFVAKVRDALKVVQFGGDKWRDYVNAHLREIKQWFGDADAHVGKIDVDGKTMLIRGDVGDVLWLAQAIVHEAAHAEQVKNAQKLDGQAEIDADVVTLRFSRVVGLDWHVRNADEVWMS